MHPWIKRIIDAAEPDYETHEVPPSVTDEDVQALAPYCRHLVLRKVDRTAFVTAGLLLSTPFKQEERTIEVLLLNARPSLAPS